MADIITPTCLRFQISACCVVLATCVAASALAEPTAEQAPLLQDDRLSAYIERAAREARNHDSRQDISPWQMLLLLEVSERTGANLGQMLATGEFESARTWNDHIRPHIGKGEVGRATGVWQFQPATFHRIIERYGDRLLSLTSADDSSGTGSLDLGAGPFCDSHVRMIIQDTIDGLRGTEDEELLLLRYNFAVLAFSKHFLSVDTGSTNPVEDYLFHFLGEGRGRRILDLANGPARDTLAVKPKAIEAPPAAPAAPGGLDLKLRPRAVVAPGRYLDRGPGAKLQRQPVYLGRAKTQPATVGQARADARPAFQPAIRSSDVSIAAQPTAPAVSSAQGFDYDSAVVTSNLRMFYRDGDERSDPYTWAEFMQHLSRRVRAERQPAMVRAKYGVGFPLEGGDMPDRAIHPEKVKKARTFRHADGEVLPVPEAMIFGTLTAEETEEYKRRLQALLGQGEVAPTDTLSDEAVAVLRGLGVLASDVDERSTSDPEVRKALSAFRRQVGKAKPADPEHEDQLMPAEQVALELYGQRLSYFQELQAEQIASAPDSPDLRALKKLPEHLQRRAASHIVMLQHALVQEGLLEQPKKKRVWRDKKRRKRISYKTVPFRGLVDNSTLAALERFQLRNGLRQGGGKLDALTQRMLGLPIVEADELFLPLIGPMCIVEPPANELTFYEILIGQLLPESGSFSPIEEDPTATSIDRRATSCAIRAIPMSNCLRSSRSSYKPQIYAD